MKILIKGDSIRMDVVQPLYKDVVKTLSRKGKPIKDENNDVIKITQEKFIKDIHTKRWFEIRNISQYGEYVGATGRKSKTKSQIFDKSAQSYYNVAHRLSELEEILQNPIPKDIIGFRK